MTTVAVPARVTVTFTANLSDFTRTITIITTWGWAIVLCDNEQLSRRDREKIER